MCVFFFQAEDGIRGKHVTGVQTCALPISVRRVNISDKNRPLLMDYIDLKKITYLPYTAGRCNLQEAIRT